MGLSSELFRIAFELKWESSSSKSKYCIIESFSGLRAALGEYKEPVALRKKCQNQTFFYKEKAYFPHLHFCLVSFLRVKAETLSWACATGATCPLLGRGLADGRDQEGLHSDTWVVHLIGKGHSAG